MIAPFSFEHHAQQSNAAIVHLVNITLSVL